MRSFELDASVRFIALMCAGHSVTAQSSSLNHQEPVPKPPEVPAGSLRRSPSRSLCVEVHRVVRKLCVRKCVKQCECKKISTPNEYPEVASLQASCRLARWGDGERSLAVSARMESRMCSAMRRHLTCGGLQPHESARQQLEDCGVSSSGQIIFELDFLRDAADASANARKACGDLVQKACLDKTLVEEGSRPAERVPLLQALFACEAYSRGSQDNLTVVMAFFEWEVRLRGSSTPRQKCKL